MFFHRHHDSSKQETFDQAVDTQLDASVVDESLDSYPDDTLPLPKNTIFKPRLHKPSFLFSVLVNTIRLLVLVVLLSGLAVGGALFGVAKGYSETAPTLDLTLIDEQDRTSFFYDCNGDVITDYKGTENRVMINIAYMSDDLKNAFVAVEDARFYTHNGIDLKRILASFINNFTSSSPQGGSTITQQLIKNTILSSELSYKRKIQEAYLAMQLETQYSKLEILESYLNTIYLGENYYGVQVASQGYFGKDPLELSLRECAMLAGLTSSPYYYNPRRNFYTRESDTTDYAAITNDRTDYVLYCMYENEFITKEEYEAALDPASANVLESELDSDYMYDYPHYIEYAVQDVIDCFLELEGLEDTSANRSAMEQEIRTGGYHIMLAVDPEIQTILEEEIETYNNYPSLRDPSDKVYQTLNSDGTYNEVIQPQAAAVVLDYRTGELKGIVGSRTVPTAMKTLNRATDMKMPIGSTIKPIAVYAPAIELGASPASIVYNMPLPISGWTDSDGNDSWPLNYGGGSYVGPQSLREAMRKSHNVSAAQTLLNLVGVDNSVSYLLQMGVDIDNIDSTPFGLSLGSSGITPMQLTVAYGVLANGGVYQEPISFIGITNSNGEVIYDSHAEQESTQVFRPSTSWLITDMLKTGVSSGTATNAKISGQTVGGKTGTNSDERGITFAGMTGWYSSALWIGHDNYQPLSSQTTSNGYAAPLWQNYMERIHEVKELEDRDIVEAEPEDVGLVLVTTCAVSGQLATEACYNDVMGYGTITDYWYAPTVPTVSCQMHQSMVVCNHTNMLANQYCTSTSTRGVIVVPNGHPLSTYLSDPNYSSVVTEYLGLTSSMTYCTYHSATTESGTDTVVTNTLIPDAQQLIQSANSLISSLDPSSSMYINVTVAVQKLEAIIYSSSPTITDVAGGMAALTQAMAGN